MADNVVVPYDPNSLSKGGAYELRMGREAFTTDSGDRVILDGVKRDVEIKPGHFALLLTKERVRIPVDSLGFISIKLSLKAKGLINVSGFHVDPGYDGWLTFSVFNAGPRPITVSRDSCCFLLWLAHWDEPVAAACLYPSDKVDARGSAESLSDEMVDQLKGDFSSPMALKQEFEQFKRLQRWILSIGTPLAILASLILGAVITKSVEAGWDWIASLKSTPTAVQNNPPAQPPAANQSGGSVFMPNPSP